MSGWAASDGEPAIGDTPFCPWHATQVTAIAGGLGGGSGGAASAADRAASRTIALRKMELDFAGIAFDGASFNYKIKRCPIRDSCRGWGCRRTDRLLRVTDLIDRARLIVGHQQGAVGRL